MKKIQIGIIGTGGIAREHAHACQQVEEIHVHSVYDVHEEAARAFAEKYQIDHVVRSSDELLRNEEIDAVIIAVPNVFHTEFALQALQYGKHVLLEKPMATHLEDALKIYKALQSTDRILMIAHQMRFHPVIKRIDEQIRSGALGHIYHGKAGWVRRKGIPGYGGWFTQKKLSGGGPLIDLGVHMLDVSIALMGSPTPVSVSGSVYSMLGSKGKGIGGYGAANRDGIFDVEDYASAQIRFDNGSTLQLEVSWAAHLDTDNEPFVELMGTEGGAKYRAGEGKLLTEIFEREADVELKVSDDDPHERVEQARHFVQCIREQKEPVSNVQTGLINQAILDAIYRSSSERKEVQVHLDWM